MWAFLWVNKHMEDYEIASSLEWVNIRFKLEKSRKNLSMFKNDIDKMLAAIDTEVKKLGNLEVLVRNQKTKGSIDRAQQQLGRVNQMIKNFNKFYMIALMSYA